MAAFPGDELLPAATLVIDHTRHLDSPRSEVWPWIVQLGKGRAGWYLPYAVERFVPARFRATRTIISRWQSLAVGDRVADYGGRHEWLEVAIVDAPSVLVYRSERFGTWFTWALLASDSPDGSIIHLRFRGVLRSRGWRQRCVLALANAADFLTAVPMLVGLNDRLRDHPTPST